MPHVTKLAAKAGILLAKREKVTPLEYMLAVLNQRSEYDPIRFNAAVAAAPYCHARLAAVAIKEVPDANAERRKSMLAGLNYQQRQAIAGILAAAALDDGRENERESSEPVAR